MRIWKNMILVWLLSRVDEIIWKKNGINSIFNRKLSIHAWFGLSVDSDVSHLITPIDALIRRTSIRFAWSANMDCVKME